MSSSHITAEQICNIACAGGMARSSHITKVLQLYDQYAQQPTGIRETFSVYPKEIGFVNYDKMRAFFKDIQRMSGTGLDQECVNEGHLDEIKDLGKGMAFNLAARNTYYLIAIPDKPNFEDSYVKRSLERDGYTTSFALWKDTVRRFDRGLSDWHNVAIKIRQQPDLPVKIFIYDPVYRQPQSPPSTRRALENSDWMGMIIYFLGKMMEYKHLPRATQWQVFIGGGGNTSAQCRIISQKFIRRDIINEKERGVPLRRGEEMAIVREWEQVDVIRGL